MSRALGWITGRERVLGGRRREGVCVIKDKERKLEEVEASHRLGGAVLDGPYEASMGGMGRM